MNEKKEGNISENDTLVVGLGASAGGVPALKSFFSSLPDETGMAFIVVLHLAPDHESNLSEILQKETSLTVGKVTEKTEIKPEHVYVIPPDKMLAVVDNHLELSEPDKKHRPNTIDLLFRTLAQKKEDHAAGIILSGAGTDGSVGMKAIKEHGGFAIAQNPDEASHPNMPQSAINTGVIDKVLPVVDITEELVKYKENLSRLQFTDKDKGQKNEEILSKIFADMESKTGHDFNNYRRSSVLRRLDRRMRVNRVSSLSEYARYLKENPDELDKLFKDLLISVTDFFRDPETFKALEEQVIPQIFEDKDGDEQVRVWVPGCATGEEAYSVAILLKEYAMDHNLSHDIQVFASDIDEEALDTARKGVYPDSISTDVTETRLRRFFIKDDNTYRVNKNIRDSILFASHDLLRTPPFSNQDLITCRNLLIYFNRDLQSEVFSLFHYALRPNGWLFLGTSDARIEMNKRFTPVDKEHRIYQQKPSREAHVNLPSMPLLHKKPPNMAEQHKSTPTQQKKNMEETHWRILARLYAPQSVLITSDYEVIHSTAGINKFLEYDGGAPSSSILDMVKPEIRQQTRNLLFQLEEENNGKESVTRQKKVRITGKDGAPNLELSARKFSDWNLPEGVIHLVFKEVSQLKDNPKEREQIPKGETTEEEADYIESLEQELEYAKEKYETNNEALRASNEELQSMNEELHTTAEELETSQEEQRSVNEELTTVNDELETKINELNRAHSDLENLMEAMEVGIIFVDNDCCIQRFTSSSTAIFNLISSDIGRPLNHITHSLEYDSIIDDVKQALDNLENIKKVVSSNDGRWFIMRMRPYRSTKDKIDGAVITFTEFTELKEARDTIKEQSYQKPLATLGVYALEKPDLQDILKRAIDLGCISLELDCAAVYLYNQQNNSLELGPQSGCANEIKAVEVEDKWDIGFGFNNKNVITTVESYHDEDRFILSPYLENEDIESSIHLKIRSLEEDYGLLGFYSCEKRKFTDDEVHFLQSLANIVGMAMRQEYAKEELRKETERSKKYQKEILDSSISERWKLGGFLHDDLSQFLISIKMIADMMDQKTDQDNPNLSDDIDRINELIKQSMENIRNLIRDIIPIDLEEEGIQHSLELLMQQTKKVHKIDYSLETDDIINAIRNRTFASHLFHVIQEAVKNAAIHGQANKIKVIMTQEEQNLVVKIADDGSGFYKTEVKEESQGLRIMKYRMELIGGTFKIEKNTSPTEGMCVTCKIPLEYVTKEEK